jgi:hypothetical protein
LTVRNASAGFSGAAVPVEPQAASPATSRAPTSARNDLIEFLFTIK